MVSTLNKNGKRYDRVGVVKLIQNLTHNHQINILQVGNHRPYPCTIQPARYPPMPFVRKTDLQGPQPPSDALKLFIGTTGELLFFVQNILQPEEPTHTIISIWGQGGVGKSTLQAHFID